MHALQARRQAAHLGIELRQAPRVVGRVAHGRAQRLGDGAQRVQKATGVVCGLGHGVAQGVRQAPARHTGACGLAGDGRARSRTAVAWRAQRLAVHVQHQARQVGQRGAQPGCVLGNVGDFLHLHELADAQRAAGQPVDPGQA